MDKHDQEFEELLVSRITDHIEKGISEQESKRFRNLYIIVGFVSFMGFGVFSQLVDFYASRAVESKLEYAKQELESAKVFSQLLALATKLDLSDSFTNTDRDTVVSLLEGAKDNTKLRSEPAFISLLEKIIDSFYESNNSLRISIIADIYQNECTRNSGIALTLLQHYGREYLAEIDNEDKTAKDNLTKLQIYIGVLSEKDATGVKGAAEGFRVLAEFKKGNLIKSKSVEDLLASYEAFNSDQKKQFAAVVTTLSNLESMAKTPTPETIRVSDVAQKFMNTYKSELIPIIENHLEQ